MSGTQISTSVLKPGEGPLSGYLPPELRQVLASGLITRIMDPEDGGGVMVAERLGWEPKKPSGVMYDLCVWALDLMQDNMRPISPETLGPTIGKLLAHYERRSDDRDPNLVEALLVDWIEDLVEYPRWAIDNACREWRRSQRWCPTIADIRRICEQEVANDRRTMRLLTKLLEADE